MRVLVVKDYEAQCRAGADLVEEAVRRRPDCRLGLATGSSPLGLYRELIRRCREEGLDFSRTRTVNLDEYVGLAPEHPQSYRTFMDQQFFDQINIDKRSTYVPRGDRETEESLAEFRAVLDQGSTAVQILGLGADGHIGFNEPGETLHARAHVETLDESTIRANSRFFENRDQVPRRALTMGMGEIMAAERLLLLISGAGKEEAARRLLLEDLVTPRWPVTFLRLHRDATVLLTRDLAERIGYRENIM